MADKFETSIKELEEIVKALESGSVSLDESLSLFEKGVKLTKNCQKLLDEAEKKVSVLVNDSDGNIVKKDFINEE